MQNISVLTDSDLEAASAVDDVDRALYGLQEKAGITDGGVAGMVFAGGYEARWARASRNERLSMLREWVRVENAYEKLYAANNDAPKTDGQG